MQDQTLPRQQTSTNGRRRLYIGQMISQKMVGERINSYAISIVDPWWSGVVVVEQRLILWC